MSSQAAIPRSKHQKIEKHEMEAVSKLYTEAETRRRAQQPTEKPLISMIGAAEIVEECIESEFSEQEPIQTDKKEEKDMESGILDDTTLDQCGASNVWHANSMDDLTWQLDIGLPPCTDTAQTLLEYEEDLATHYGGIYTSRFKIKGGDHVPFSLLFLSGDYLLTEYEGRRITTMCQ